MSASHGPKRVPKAPIINPFDQFPAKEFDAFVEDITSALRRALGHEPITLSPHSSPNSHGNERAEQAGHDTGNDSDESASALDETELARRREIAHGKRRDPRERPGESRGQAITILSDSEEGSEAHLGETYIGYDEEVYSDEVTSEDEMDMDEAQCKAKPVSRF